MKKTKMDFSRRVLFLILALLWSLSNSCKKDSLSQSDEATLINPSLPPVTTKESSIVNQADVIKWLKSQPDAPTSVGGQLSTFYYDHRTPQKDVNTCALRLSKGLNYTGVLIPNIPGKTFRGANNAYYFVRAADLREWMIKTFGKPTGSNQITGAQGGNRGQNFAALMKGKIGIYIMTPNDPAVFKASGHADFLNYLGCDGGCFLPPTGGAKEVLIWILN